jgi:hypothetical protein
VEGRADELLLLEGDRKGVQVLDAKDMADEPVVVDEERIEDIQVGVLLPRQVQCSSVQCSVYCSALHNAH